MSEAAAKTHLVVVPVETAARRFNVGEPVSPEEFTEKDYQSLLVQGALQPLNFVHITSGDSGEAEEMKA